MRNRPNKYSLFLFWDRISNIILNIAVPSLAWKSSLEITLAVMICGWMVTWEAWSCVGWTVKVTVLTGKVVWCEDCCTFWEETTMPCAVAALTTCWVIKSCGVETTLLVAPACDFTSPESKLGATKLCCDCVVAIRRSGKQIEQNMQVCVFSQ